VTSICTSSSHGDETAGRVIDLNRVTVVDDMERRPLIGELNRREIGCLGAPDINRGLVSAQLARTEGLVELAPMVGAVNAAIAPMRCGVLLGKSGGSDE
jgi:hypothetical protein